MVFFDLNIPHQESDRHISAADKANLKTHRLKLTIKAAELGYTGVAYNRSIKGVMSEADRCSISLFPLSSLLKVAPSLSSSVKFHRDLLNIGVSKPFRQYTRLTVVVDSSSQAAALNSGNPILTTYDIVAVRPMNQNAFEQACRASEIDVIAIDFSEKLPLRLKQPLVEAAIERGVYFEITYCSLIMDAQVRRQMISNAKLLVDWTRGKNLIVSSDAPSVCEIRGPYDVANLLSLLGLSFERAKAAVSKNCRSLIANSLRKKGTYKEAIKVEAMPSSERVNSEETAFDDWLNWDTISSGEGDLQLDDIEKSFSVSGSVSTTMKSKEFAAALNSLPSLGLRIEDVIPIARAAPEPLDVGNNLSGAEDTEVAVALNGISEESGVLSLLPDDGQNSVLTTHRDSGHEDSKTLLLHNSPVNVEGNSNPLVTHENLRRAKELDACSSPSWTELCSLQSQSFLASCDEHVSLPDDATLRRCANDTEIAHTCDGFGCVKFCTNSNDAKTPGESKIQVSFHVGLQAESVSVEEYMTEMDRKNGKELALSDVPLNEEFLGSEEFQEKKETLVALADELPVEESHDLIEENEFLVAEIEPLQEDGLDVQKQKTNDIPQSYQILGRGQVKRRTSYQPFLFPFKHLLTSRPFRKKIRNLNPL